MIEIRRAALLSLVSLALLQPDARGDLSVFSGLDSNVGATAGTAVYPNSSAAFGQFTSVLTAFATENLEDGALDPGDPNRQFFDFGNGTTGSAGFRSYAPAYPVSGVLSVVSDFTTATPVHDLLLSGDVTALGFYISNIADAGQTTAISVQFSNGGSNVRNINFGSFSGNGEFSRVFLGIVDTLPFDQIIISANCTSIDGLLFDDFTVGSAIPEPASAGILATGVVLALVRRRQQRRFD